MATPVVKITDGTTTVDFFGGVIDGELTQGFVVKSWSPSLAPIKGGGVWTGSPFTEGRALAMRTAENTIDNYNLSGSFTDQDSAIYHLQELRRLLEKAVAYWVTDWQNEPVWLEVSGSMETNTRYAIIKDYSTPHDPSPFAQPMFSCPSVIDDFLLSIEHGVWSSEIPGGSTCVETSEGGMMHGSLEFNGTTSIVDCGSAASITDLPDGANGMTAEAWIRVDGEGDSAAPRIFDKLDVGAVGWRFFIDYSDTYATGAVLGARALFATQAFAYAKYPDDGEWHHVACVLEPVGDDWTLFIDGVEQTLLTSQSGSGAYATDVGEDFHIGNRDSADRTFEGLIGWSRLSDTEQYTADFTPNDRCTPPVISQPIFPPIDITTEAQWHMTEGAGTTLRDYYGLNYGTITDGTWSEADCPGPRKDTCEREVMISNQNTSAQLTHIYIEDDNLGTWTDNLAPTTDYKLFRDPTGQNDAIYFGIATTGDDGPFFNLIFDIEIAASGLTLIWEYYNGAGWTAFAANAYRDVTESFTATGVASISWVQNNVANWATGNLQTIFGGSAPAVAAWWIRCRVTNAPGAHTVPEQQNRKVYSVIWNTIDIEADQIVGDISAIARNLLEIQSWFAVSTPAEYWAQNRTIVGLRSLSRGENFSSIIPLSDRQTPPYVTVNSTYGFGSFGSSIYASTGRCMQTAALTGDVPICNIIFDKDVIREYTGTYRVFLRYARTSGVAENVKIKLVQIVRSVMAGSVIDTVWNGKWGHAETDWPEGGLMDLGSISFPPYTYNLIGTQSDDRFGAVDLQGTTLQIHQFDCSVAVNMNFYDLILIPVDEWSADIYVADFRAAIGKDSPLETVIIDIDSIQNPKRHLRAIERRTADTTMVGTQFSVITGGRMKLNANSAQRLHYVTAAISWELEVSEDKNVWHSIPGIVDKVQLYKQERYLSMRGSR